MGSVLAEMSSWTALTWFIGTKTTFQIFSITVYGGMAGQVTFYEVPEKHGHI